MEDFEKLKGFVLRAQKQKVDYRKTFVLIASN